MFAPLHNWLTSDTMQCNKMMITLTFLIAGIAIVSGGAPDNRGTEFVIGYMENRDLTMDVELYITTVKTTTVYVQVSAPNFPSLGLNENFAITTGDVKQIFISNSVRAYQTALETKGILITASDEVVVYGTNKERYSNDAFLAFPTDVLGMDYYVVTQWPSNPLLCEFMIVGVEDNTEVTITYGSHSDLEVYYNGAYYREGSTQTLTMNRFDTFQAQSQGDLTSTRIVSTKKVAVYSGNSRTNVNPWDSSRGTKDAIVDQMLPVDTWGKEFAIVPTPSRTVGDLIKFLCGNDDAQVVIDCSGTYYESFTVQAGEYVEYVTPSDQVCHVSSDNAIMVILFVISQLDSSEVADPSIITIPPIEQYSSEFTFATPQYSFGSYQNLFMFIVNEAEKDGLKIDGQAFPANTVYTQIPNTDYVGGYIEVTEGSHTIRHDSPISVFCGFIYGMAHAETYGMPTGLRMAPINLPCVQSTTSTGDGYDNDCDGKIDEEICTVSPAIDDDGDGLIDEDCVMPLPIDGNWGTWGSWESTCYCINGGSKPRRRECNDPEPQYDGRQCDGDDTDYTSCTTSGSCPVDGGYTDWSAWGGCSQTCGTGSLSSTRSCTNPSPANGGRDCTHLGIASMTMNCYNNDPCPDPIDGGYSAWSAWAACPVSCGTGTTTRSRTCTNPSPEHGGNDCSSLGADSETGSCDSGVNCPVNGGYGNWAAWGTCSVTCATGTQDRTRTCSNPSPAYGGSDCTSLGASSETQSCDTGVACAVNGGYSQWSSWGTCSVTCATGTHDRTRSCTNPSPANGGSDCASLGADSETQSCDTGVNCPIDGGYGSWSAWGTCSVTCATGTEERTRTCSNPSPAYGGSDCTSLGSDTDTKSCDSGVTCPVDGGYTTWTAWAACPVSCGTSTTTRSRTCTSPSPAHGGSDCTSLGADSETQACDSGVNCPVDGGYGSWSAWGSCSVTCATGTEERTRTCSNPSPAYGGSDCASLGADTETQSCDTGVICPVHGGYSSWSVWGTCSVTCATGTEERTRTCSNPTPAHGGSDCTSLGSDTDTQSCDTGVNCPVNGGFTSWTTWTDCSVTCAIGTEHRNRTCTNPSPAYGGIDCTSLGDELESQDCDTNVTCPNRDGGWNVWGNWTECTKTCNTGQRIRVRLCDNPVPLNGLPCQGDAIQIDQCNTDACTAASGSGGSSLNAYSNTVCPTGFFPCRGGYITCIESEFACDCAADCSDGSDEDGDWAQCSPEVVIACQNGAQAIFTTSHLFFAVLLQIFIGLAIYA